MAITKERLEEQEEMFVQYWFNTSRKILMLNELKDTLFRIWSEVCEKFSDYNYEDKWFRIGDFYKERITKGETE